jgi:transposase
VFKMKVTLIGIDLAKTIFQVCGVNQAGKTVFNRQLRRNKLMALLMQHPEATIAMEACSGSNYWGRELEQKGSTGNDAFAICEAACRPDIRCVQPRSLAQTDTMLIHRILERRVSERNSLMNQVRGLLNEYGVVVARGKEKLRNELPFILEDAENELTETARYYLHRQLLEWRELDSAITELDKAIAQQVKSSEQSSRLKKIKGVGNKISSAAEAFMGNGSGYRSGRHFAANLGLVPKEHSSGGKQRLGRITKRGNAYLRRLLIQGAWSVIRYADHSEDRLSRWAKQLIERRGKHKAAIAVANKLARIIWAMSYHQTEYRAN